LVSTLIKDVRNFKTILRRWHCINGINAICFVSFFIQNRSTTSLPVKECTLISYLYRWCNNITFYYYFMIIGCVDSFSSFLLSRFKTQLRLYNTHLWWNIFLHLQGRSLYFIGKIFFKNCFQRVGYKWEEIIKTLFILLLQI
jgi:hypothetical protein